MEVSPELGLVVGALITVVGLYYRHLLKLLDEEKAEAEYWRVKALEGTTLAEIATDQLEKKTPARRN